MVKLKLPLFEHLHAVTVPLYLTGTDGSTIPWSSSSTSSTSPGENPFVEFSAMSTTVFASVCTCLEENARDYEDAVVEYSTISFFSREC
jgi:hypothetical protein